MSRVAAQGFRGSSSGLTVPPIAVKHHRKSERNIRISLFQGRTVFQILQSLLQPAHFFIQQSTVKQSTNKGRLYFKASLKDSKAPGSSLFSIWPSPRRYHRLASLGARRTASCI